MKKLILLLAIGLSCAFCSGRNQYSILYLKSYVQAYVEPGVLEVSYDRVGRARNEDWINDEDGIYYIEFDVGSNPELYIAPEFGRDCGTEEYLALAARNGDRSYNREEDFLGPTPHPKDWCYAQDFREIRVVCTNADWDESHPKGTLLNDLIQIYFKSGYDYVQSGYDAYMYPGKVKLLPELTANDLRMFQVRFELRIRYAEKENNQDYNLRITLVTTDGEEVSVEHKCSL